MPNLQEHTLSAAALDRLIELARANDLLETIHYDFAGIADAPDTVLEINLDGQAYRVSAYALGEAAMDTDASSGLDPAVIEGRAALRSFIDALTAIPASDFVDEEHPLDITALRIYASKAAIVPDSELPGAARRSTGRSRTWPRRLPGANSPLGARCLPVKGDDLARCCRSSAGQRAPGVHLERRAVQPDRPAAPARRQRLLAPTKAALVGRWTGRTRCGNAARSR
jgi:hypothetical protein